ncbi:MAG: 23S rRNA (adenine(2503)-C(2))-methyltransferase RlmN [Kineosporiaceae bacterium]
MSTPSQPSSSPASPPSSDALTPDADGRAALPVAQGPVVPPPGTISLASPRRPRPPRHLADLDLSDRAAVVTELGLPAFRAKQVSVQYFDRLVDDAAQMSDLPLAARPSLGEALLPRLLAPAARLECDGGATVKTVWRLFDGAVVESVLMRYARRSTVCVSSQAGCGMNCPFCATGQAGLTRNLSTAEIVEQVLAASRALGAGGATGAGAPMADPGVLPGLAGATELGAEADDEQGAGASAAEGAPGRRVNNVVFMGMGEPLANYAAVLGAVRRLLAPSPEGAGMSARGITISTVGLVPAMQRLAGEGLPVTLALSLHAPDDEARDELVPVNTRWKVAEALDAARAYAEATGRRVSIEYALIKDVNDQAWRADLLGRLLTRRGRGWVHVNPIPLNPTPGSRWTASLPQVQDAFVDTLRAHGVPTTVRDTRGREIDGACGQLAAGTVAAGG